MQRIYLQAFFKYVEGTLAWAAVLYPADHLQQRNQLSSGATLGLLPEEQHNLSREELNRRRLVEGKSLLAQPAQQDPVIWALLTNEAAMIIVTKLGSDICLEGNKKAHRLVLIEELQEIITGPNNQLNPHQKNGMLGLLCYFMALTSIQYYCDFAHHFLLVILVEILLQLAAFMYIDIPYFLYTLGYALHAWTWTWSFFCLFFRNTNSIMSAVLYL